MVGLYIFGGVAAVCLIALIFYKVKWGRADRAEARGRAGREEERTKK